MSLSKIDVSKMITGVTPLTNGGTGGTSIPATNLASGVTGTLPVGNGGIGIASGTTDQFLKFTGTTTLASAADNAGTWVQITKVVNDNVGATSVEFQNCFTTTYKLYKIVCRVFRPSSDNDYCRMRLMTGTNTPYTGGDYRRANTMFRSNNTTDTSYGDSDEFRIMEGVEDAISESGGMFVMYASINKSVAGSAAFKFTGTSSYTEGNANSKVQSTGVIGGFYYNNITNVNSTGFLLRSAGNITEIDCTVYGVVQT